MKKMHRKILSLFLSAVMVFSVCLSAAVSADTQDSSASAEVLSEIGDDVLYLSDKTLYGNVLMSCTMGYGAMTFDTNIDGGPISLLVDGHRLYFEKGIGLHAKGFMFLDFERFEQLTTTGGYDRFTAYLGVDYSKAGYGDGVTYRVYVSPQYGKDYKEIEWELYLDTGVMTGDSEAVLLDVDLNTYKSVYIEIDENGNNSSDHSMIADAKITKAGYEPAISSVIKTVDEYDQLIKEFVSAHSGETYSQLLENYADFKTLVLQRTFVDMAGYATLSYYGTTQENLDTISWLMNDSEALELYINGGEPNGDPVTPAYSNSLDVLKALLAAHKADLDDTVNGSLYKKMMITLSLTHSIDVPFWEDSTQVSDPVTRYEIYKKLYENELLLNDVFADLNVEEMRWVFNNLISDDQIEWLNYYVRFETDRADYDELTLDNFTPGPYYFITYGFDYDYYKEEYYTEENKDMWQAEWILTNEYKLSDEETGGKASVYDINVDYESGKPKLWIVFEEGSVCGGIAKTGTNLLAVFGVPGVILTQPGHAAYLQLGANDNGEYTWSIGNDVSGWTLSQREEYYGREDTRMLLGWGNESWASEYYASYVLLAQAVLNNEETYYKSNLLNKLAEVYEDSPETQIAIYEEALTIESKNLDSWEGLINAYANAQKSESDFVGLAQRISENLKYYPLPMNDIILNLLLQNVDGAVARSEIENYVQSSLNAAAQATEADVLQPTDTITMANYLLGNTEPMATFSFDGDNAGKIILNPSYSGDNQLLYSISGDGEDEWINAGTVTEVQLTEEQLAKVNANDKILVRLQGTTNYYTINIVQGEMPENAYANDNENRIMGVDQPMEYHTGDGVWKDVTEDTRFDGVMTVTVRIKANGTTTQSNEKTFEFTEDSPEDRKYITIDRMSISDVSSEETSWGEVGANAIDGNINTIWHTLWDGSDDERYITVKFDDVVKLTAFEYTPRQGLYSGNGRVLSYELYTSTDGSRWDLAASGEGWADDQNKKIVELEEPVEAQYVKFVAVDSVGNFMSAAMLEFYEDTTKTYEFGDVNHDEKVDIQDVTLIQKYLARLDMSDGIFDTELADINGDGEITVIDATYLQMYIAYFQD